MHRAAAAAPIDPTRTEEARIVIAQKGWKTIHIDGQSYLLLGRARIPHLILHGDVTHFLDRRIAFVDKDAGCEILTLNPNSPLLNDRFQLLKRRIKRRTEQLEKMKAHITIADKLNCVMELIREDLGGDGTRDLVNRVAAFCAAKRATNETSQGEAIIPIDELIGKEGFCRHRMMYGVYLLDRLKEEGILPPGDIYAQIDNLSPGGQRGHAWIIYKVKDTGQLFLIDPMWFDKVHDVTNGKNVVELGYGEKIKQRIIARYGNPIRVNPPIIVPAAQKADYKADAPNQNVKIAPKVVVPEQKKIDNAKSKLTTLDIFHLLADSSNEDELLDEPVRINANDIEKQLPFFPNPIPILIEKYFGRKELDDFKFMNNETPQLNQNAWKRDEAGLSEDEFGGSNEDILEDLNSLSSTDLQLFLDSLSNTELAQYFGLFSAGNKDQSPVIRAISPSDSDEPTENLLPQDVLELTPIPISAEKRFIKPWF